MKPKNHRADTGLTHAQIQQFKIDGYLILPSILTLEDRKNLTALTQTHLAQRTQPFELETDVSYPGSPEQESSTGGDTIRRLLLAYQRDIQFKTHAERAEIVDSVAQILGGDQIYLNPNHHNCVMTKQPKYSSETLWHRDTRYWNFDNKYLINAWFALGDEKKQNGAMKILPGSHRWDVLDDALDEAQFLKLDHPDNRWRLDTQRLVELEAGDVLLFSAHCFHAAGKNTTNQPKFSMVFTYHNEQTKPVPGTTTDNLDELSMPTARI